MIRGFRAGGQTVLSGYVRQMEDEAAYHPIQVQFLAYPQKGGFDSRSVIEGWCDGVLPAGWELICVRSDGDS